MDDCTICGRRLDDGECTRCALVIPPETTESRTAKETTAAKRATRKK